MKHRLRIVMLLFIAAAALAFAPADLRISDTLYSAFYHTEIFQQQNAFVPNPPVDSRQKLNDLITKDPGNAVLYKELAEVEVQLLDFAQAEAHMRQYVEKSSDKDQAYSELETFYHQRLRFADEVKAMNEHVRILTPQADDISGKTGRYALYQQIVKSISSYGLPDDPKFYYQAAIDSYPTEKQPYLDYIDYYKNAHHHQPGVSRELAAYFADYANALERLESFKQKFPDDHATYLKTMASLVDPDRAFQLLSEQYDPLWDPALIQSMDAYAVSSGKKGEYLAGLQMRLQKNPLDFDAVTRLFYAYHLAGNAIEAQNALNDYRLLKDQKGQWTPQELYVMARLNQLVMNYNEAARYYYALFTATRSGSGKAPVKPDDALSGLYEVLLAAEDRPVQLGAGNLDYYKDIATADSNPGVLNGLLSLILNNDDPAYEFEQQEQKALGYFNRAQAFRLLQYMQRTYPSSPHIPAMLRDCLRIYEKYGMDELIIRAGESFYPAFANAEEILDVGLSVADAYARTRQHEKEWQTYEKLLSIAATRQKGKLITSTEGQPVNYMSILNRYIGSLTGQKNYLVVVQLYRNQIAQHPDEQVLYENFTTYLSQNQLFDDEAEVYSQAIKRFQQKSWYEKLARWYLRHQRKLEFEKTSRSIVDIFRGTEVESYLDGAFTGDNPYRDLYWSLNQYAHEKFPLNLHFVRNLLSYYSNQTKPNWQEWNALAEQYYFLDESIRNEYLEYLSRNGRLPSTGESTNPVQKRFTADVKVWKSHFEEAVPVYEELASSYSSESEMNLRLADLKRSLGVQKISNYTASAKIRQRLAEITPSDSALWTTAGETLADIEQYDGAKAYWQKILEIDPRNPDRYLEVATILWDYYLFDDALAAIEKARVIKDDPTLFAYEAGAIEESKRDYPKAVAEYARSLVSDSESARTRLGELYHRNSLVSLVRQELDRRLQQNAQDPDWWLGVIRFTLDQKERELAQQLIARAHAGLKPEPFTSAAQPLKDICRDHGFYDLEELIIQTQITRAASDSDRLALRLELARFYEGRTRGAQAESMVAALYHEQPRSAGIIDELLSYYWRSSQYAKAFAVYKEILPAANEHFRKRFLLEAANRYRERGDFSNALAYAQQLVTMDALNADYFGLIAELLAEKKDYAALSEHYKNGLKMVRDSDLSADQKKQRIAELRHGVIRASVILKETTAALDQHIEIVNGAPESESSLQEAAEFGRRYGLFSRLVEYYRKTAAASPRDHRWPMVLGRLHVFSGEYEEAIKDFQGAIAIHPERTDFYKQLALCFQRLGKYQEAIDTYSKLYALTYKDPRWLDPMADLSARLGNKEKALELYTTTLADDTDLEKDQVLCIKTLDWGMTDEAVKYGDAAFREYESDMSQDLDSDGLDAYLQALFQSGREIDALHLLQQTYDRIQTAEKSSTFDTGALSSAEYIVKETLIDKYPELIKKYLTGERIADLHEAVLAEAKGNTDRSETLYLPLVRSAAMAPAEERILQDMAESYFHLHKTEQDENWNKYRSMRSQLKNFYRERGAYARCADWLNEQWKRSTHHPDFREDLVEIADAYRLAGKPEQEIAALREYYRLGPQYTLNVDPVERYLSLLYDMNRTYELEEAAAHANLPAANYFVKRGDKQMAGAAIESLAANKTQVWRTVEQAMLGRQLRDASFDLLFHTGLDLRTIGEQLDQPGDEETSVLGDDWSYYATRYGEFLWWTGKKTDAVAYLPSDLEGLSTDGGRQNALGKFYFDEKNFGAALQHYSLAAEMIPNASRFLDDRARALAESGKMEEAIAGWKKMTADVGSTLAYELFVQSAIDYGFVDSVRGDIESFIERKIETSGSSGLETLLPLYLKTVPESSLLPLLDRWIAPAPAPKEFAYALLDYDFLNTDTRLRIYGDGADYLNNWMTTATGQELANLRWDVMHWNDGYARELLKAKQFDRALSAASLALEQAQKRDEEYGYPSNDQRDLALLKLKILLRSGQKDQALAAVKDFVAHGTLDTSARPGASTESAVNKDFYTGAAGVLKDEGLESESRDLLVEMYEKLLASGQTDSANYIGLAEIRLDQQKPDEAREVLRQLIFLNSENLEGMNQAAELLEKKELWSQAAEYRKDLDRRLPWNLENKSQLAEDLWKAGQKQPAQTLAATVLQSKASGLQSLTRAARLLGQSAGAPVGPTEMQDVLAFLRSGHPDPERNLRPYYYTYRTIALEKAATKPLDILLAQKFLFPQDKQIRADLFNAYRLAQNCEPALATIDPDNARSGEYYESEYDDSEDYSEGDDSYYDEDSGYGNPIEDLDLTNEQTRTLAVAAAECAEETKDLSGQLFFLKMALNHTEAEAEKQKLQEQIDRVNRKIEEEDDKENRRFKVTENLGRQS